MTLRPQLQSYAAARLAESDQIPGDRRAQLRKLAEQVRDRCRNGAANLIFICTHNSRRSHMAQIWAQAAAWHFGCEHVRTFSGGTEATAFNTSAIAALERAGFGIERAPGRSPDNPTWRVTGSSHAPAMECFSKEFDQAPNPTKDFVAVMTCSAADAQCPIVDGATARIALPYEDPKVADGTALEQLTYDERCAQIAREMLHAFQLVRTTLRDQAEPPKRPL